MAKRVVLYLTLLLAFALSQVGFSSAQSGKQTTMSGSSAPAIGVMPPPNCPDENCGFPPDKPQK